MFKNMHPNVKVGQESWRQVFINEFNISFGYPRSDTCSTCDEHQANLAAMDQELKVNPDDVDLLRKRQAAELEHTVHLNRADAFYKRKRAAKAVAERNEKQVSICMDFQKNLSTPNITTNDVYYKRQLTCISFNIHELAGGRSHFYVYDETTAKKGSDDVCSMLNHFITNYVEEMVETLEIFCDSCAGQNKNYTVFRFLHHLVNVRKRFLTVSVTFPIRGHSYMECDKQFAFVNQKVPAQMPSEWWAEFRRCRKKPGPFNVVECTQELFHNHTTHIQKLYIANCPFPTRPIRQILFSQNMPRLAYTKDSYSGPWKTTVMTKKKGQSLISRQLQPLYSGRLPLSAPKFKDIQSLAKFCGPEAKAFYAGLSVDPANDGAKDDDDSGGSEESTT